MQSADTGVLDTTKRRQSGTQSKADGRRRGHRGKPRNRDRSHQPVIARQCELAKHHYKVTSLHPGSNPRKFAERFIDVYGEIRPGPNRFARAEERFRALLTDDERKFFGPAIDVGIDKAKQALYKCFAQAERECKAEKRKS